jgi:hypothetical protein
MAKDQLHSWTNRREYVRVTADCPVVFRVLQGHDQAPPVPGRDWLWSLPMAAPSEIRSGGGHDGEGHPELVEMLLTLDWKVSLIMKRLMSESRPDLFPYAGVMSEVSGGGMKLTTDHALESGSLLELDVVLPVVPFNNMFIKGEVVQVRKVKRASETDAFEVGVAFRDVNELQLDHLVKYALKRQMALQRERRAA